MIKRALALFALATPAGAFDLAFPLDCELGETCYIQQYVDHDPGPGVQDFACGQLSYQGHDGTDIAVPSVAAMNAGVAVLAAAEGTIKGIRDGIADFAPIVPGKECGNGILIAHADGWETQYCHLRQGSVVVRAGDVVTKGAPLGLVGQSGMADFPHLHLSVRHNGVELDPFAPEANDTCGAKTSDLWSQPVDYVAGGLIAIGISNSVPEYAVIKQGLNSSDMPTNSPALVVWTYFYGAAPGDAILFELSGPDGRLLAERTILDKQQALAFRAVGKRLKAAAWPNGTYTGSARMIRNGIELGQKSISVVLTD